MKPASLLGIGLIALSAKGSAHRNANDSAMERKAVERACPDYVKGV